METQRCRLDATKPSLLRVHKVVQLIANIWFTRKADTLAYIVASWGILLKYLDDMIREMRHMSLASIHWESWTEYMSGCVVFIVDKPYVISHCIDWTFVQSMQCDIVGKMPGSHRRFLSTIHTKMPGSFGLKAYHYVLLVISTRILYPTRPMCAGLTVFKNPMFH